MPQSKPARKPIAPHPLTEGEIAIIRRAVREVYGPDVVIRNFGPEKERLQLHVESPDEPAVFARDECLRVLLRDIQRDRIDLVETKRGARVAGLAKIA